MCSIPPPPPPPVPISPDLSPSTQPLYAKTNPTPQLIEICEWASENLDLWEACAKYKISPQNAPFKYKYTHFQSIIQVGPTCGLAALSMIVRNKVSANEMLNIARMEGFTNNGEMFSCKDMVKLTEKVFSLAATENVCCELVEGGLYSHNTIQNLLDGAVLLVPYDADFNHAPCLKQGHTAHWALVCGIVIISDPGDSFDSDPSNVYVLSRHGKSRYLAAWRLDDLANSNQNLCEFSPARGKEGLVYILPEGGVGGENGLRDQFVIFKGLN